MTGTVRSERHANRGVSRADREFAYRLGSVMLTCMSADNGAAIRAIDESGLTFTQMKVLLSLTGADEAPTLKPLGESLGLSLASVSRAVDGLVKRQLLTRTEDDRDRRQRRLAPTEAGLRLSEGIIAARLEGLGQFAASLSTEERGRLESALDLLLERDDIQAAYRKYRKGTRS
jgi:DNA-binding MarR family transcriptional regulator